MATVSNFKMPSKDVVDMLVNLIIVQKEKWSIIKTLLGILADKLEDEGNKISDVIRSIAKGKTKKVNNVLSLFGMQLCPRCRASGYACNTCNRVGYLYLIPLIARTSIDALKREYKKQKAEEKERIEYERLRTKFEKEEVAAK